MIQKYSHKQHELWMRVAINEATCNISKGPYAALLIIDDRLSYIAHNQPSESSKPLSNHA